jgi:hypothetical protein
MRHVLDIPFHILQELLREGDTEGFVEAYLAAIDLQQQRTSDNHVRHRVGNGVSDSDDVDVFGLFVALPAEVVWRVTSRLGAGDVARLMCAADKRLYRLLRVDPSWRAFYFLRLGLSHCRALQEDSQAAAELEDEAMQLRFDWYDLCRRQSRGRGGPTTATTSSAPRVATSAASMEKKRVQSVDDSVKRSHVADEGHDLHLKHRPTVPSSPVPTGTTHRREPATTTTAGSGGLPFRWMLGDVGGDVVAPQADYRQDEEVSYIVLDNGGHTVKAGTSRFFTCVLRVSCVCVVCVVRVVCRVCVPERGGVDAARVWRR